MSHSVVSLFAMSRCPGCPVDPYTSSILSQWCLAELPETFLSYRCSSGWNNSQKQRQVRVFQVWWLFFLMVVWWGWTYCALNSLELEQPFMPMWLDRPRSRLGVTHDYLGPNWIPFLIVVVFQSFSPTSSPFGPLFHAFFSPGRFGPVRAEVGVGFAVLGWFRPFRLPPPPLVLLCVRRPPLFSFLARFARSGPGVLVLVFAPPLFFCVPLIGSRLSNPSSHSFSLSFHLHSPFHPHRHLICLDTTLPKAGCLWLNYIMP